MGSLIKIILYLPFIIGIVAVSVNGSSNPSKMTELQILFLKDKLQNKLRNSLFDPSKFQKYHNKYVVAFPHRDPHIEQALLIHFTEAMTHQHKKRVQLQEKINSYGVAQNTKGQKVLAGIGICAGSVALTAIGVWGVQKIIESIIKEIPLMDGDAMVPLIFLFAIGLGVKGIQEIVEGLSDEQAELNIINKAIAILDANYTHAFSGEEKLSDQIQHIL